MEKTTIHHRSGLKRLLAFLLCAVCVFGLILLRRLRFRRDRKQAPGLENSMSVLTGGIIMRRRLTPTLFTILTGRWMCAAVPGAALTGIIC